MQAAKPNSFIDQACNGLEKPAKLSTSIVGVDRFVRLTNYFLRFAKAYNLQPYHFDMKKIDSLTSKLSATRFILRRSRKWKTISDLFRQGYPYGKSIRDQYKFFLDIFTIISDSNALLSYLHYLKILENEGKQQLHLRWNMDFYFVECLCWLVLYTMDLYKRLKTGKQSENSPTTRELVLYFTRYILDSIVMKHISQVSHNDFSLCRHKFGPKVTSLLGFISSMIALYTSWK